MELQDGIIKLLLIEHRLALDLYRPFDKGVLLHSDAADENKEEYENSRFSEPKSYKGGAFKRNKTLLITLLDIAIIVVKREDVSNTMCFKWCRWVRLSCAMITEAAGARDCLNCVGPRYGLP